VWTNCGFFESAVVEEKGSKDIWVGGITMKMFVSTVIIFTAELNYFLNCAFYSISDRLLKGNDANLLPQYKPL
jgi:hypothetical protein